MQFSTLLATAVALTGASAAAIQSSIRFNIESENQEVNNKGLSSIHEGAAINYFFAGEGSESFDFDYKTGVISKKVEIADNQSYEEFFTIQEGGSGFHTLQTSPSYDNTKWAVENGYLTGNGSDTFFAVKGTNDPYNYSKESFQIGVMAPHSPNIYDAVVPIKIKATVDSVA
ncbi:putative membrane protein [Wickerhamomyces ciferrii]|uniref:Membrane protein n=1 Tax=Wickerhamomyces ciferrii (strain ATCC 14091 / BCRC 22168 / CBS 111 / JCM 3599 / NBRC 0793 / NRRL Y-1031 F-60-10) TaxID=1206466 RepID=K0KHP0_WICCF|nr:uncharacterized protein BN7_423 [Wickerhamomyces ciferrii]CCH40889.1 putative membrane protein [Wickerhamomyces ciferrii]